MRKLQDYVMTRRQAKKQQKRPAKKKTTGKVIELTGKVIELTAQGITLKTANGLFVVRRTGARVISGTLKRGSTVTLKGKILAGGQPGKRTEGGTVIGLTAPQITLQVPKISFPKDPGVGGPGTFRIDRHPDDTTVISGTLAVGSGAQIESNEADWHTVAA